MEHSELYVGKRVRIIRDEEHNGCDFYYYYDGHEGVVEILDGEASELSVFVRLDGEAGSDWGNHKSLVAIESECNQTIRQKLEEIDVLLAEIKEML